jgi:hypothetical protein
MKIESISTHSEDKNDDNVELAPLPTTAVTHKMKTQEKQCDGCYRSSEKSGLLSLTK